MGWGDGGRGMGLGVGVRCREGDGKGEEGPCGGTKRELRRKYLRLWPLLQVALRLALGDI